MLSWIMRWSRDFFFQKKQKIYFFKDEKVTKKCKDAAIEYLGKENVVELDMRMTAEDFAAMVERARNAGPDDCEMCGS